MSVDVQEQRLERTVTTDQRLRSLASGLGGHPGRMGGHGDVVLLSTDVAAAIVEQLSPRWILRVQLLVDAVVVEARRVRVPVVGDVDERTARAAAGVALRVRDLEQDLQADCGRLEAWKWVGGATGTRIGCDPADPAVEGRWWVFCTAGGDC